MCIRDRDDRGNIKTNRQGEAVEEEVCLDVYGPAFVKPGSEAALDKDAKPVLEEDKQNLTILAEALRSARERKAAIDIFKKLVKITDDGEAYIAMGNLYYQEDEIDGGWANANRLQAFALNLGLDMEQFDKCMITDDHRAHVNFNMQMAKKEFGANSTPTFVIVGPTGEAQKIVGAHPYSTFVSVLDQML